MKPAEHDNVFFDDALFGHSRKYFWAIDCLNGFELSIRDNIDQWELYKAARVSSINTSAIAVCREAALRSAEPTGIIRAETCVYEGKKGCRM